MLDQLARQIRDRRVVLFVGAGLSQRLGLPSWRALIEHMARDLGYDADILVGPGSDFMQVAEYYKLRKGSIGALRSWMDRNWHVDDGKISASKVHSQIVELDFPFIYTTNYDNNIERAFELKSRQFSKVTSVLDVATAAADLPHIVKFHGDFTDDQSLVVTESDYFERLEFDSPLDIKFRSDVLGRSILFVGYSLKDLNLRLLLFKLKRTWDRSQYADKRPKSYVFLLRPDPVQEAVLESRGVSPIIVDAVNPEEALPEFFDGLLEQVRRIT
jgi:hypothetical protein